jgi:glucosamine--fructose-6-phosphate aminotransferase (isomerizing)
MGASWNAALAAGAYFFAAVRPVYMVDASELLKARIHPGAVIVIVSRSGASAEIVKLLAQAHEAGATTIGITNFNDGLLARKANIPIVVPVTPDHGISVSTYSTLAMVATALAHSTTQTFDAELAGLLARSIASLSKAIPVWRQQLADTAWLQPSATYYFLARGASLASAYEARLLWEEGAKTPATSMGVDSFRHGPQEIVSERAHIAIWIGEQTRERDLALARDLRLVGAQVMLIGQQLPADAAELIFQLPATRADWQFLIDIVPVQLAAERLAVISGVDCDSFRLASYIVQDDAGLSLDNQAASIRVEG